MKHAARGGQREPRARRTDPAGSGSRSRLEQLPYWIIVCGAVAGLLSIRSGENYVRSGTLVLAGVLLIAAVARLLLPERRAGMLATRRRLVDAAAFGALGVGLLVAGLVLPAP
ncbi:MAG: DUF3017 domain-containing protein [Streptosporangiaceae bacterium]